MELRTYIGAKPDKLDLELGEKGDISLKTKAVATVAAGNANHVLGYVVWFSKP
jgi:hypothetical protein